jgi:hypothetical protein
MGTTFQKVESFPQISSPELLNPTRLGRVRGFHGVARLERLVRESVLPVYADCVLEVRATVAGTLRLRAVLVPTVHHRVFRQADITAA